MLPGGAISRLEGVYFIDCKCRLLPRQVNSAEILIQFDELSSANVEIAESSYWRRSSTQTLEGFKPSSSSNEIIFSIKDERVEKANPFDGRHKVFNSGEGFALSVIIVNFYGGEGDVFHKNLQMGTKARRECGGPKSPTKAAGAAP